MIHPRRLALLALCALGASVLAAGAAAAQAPQAEPIPFLNTLEPHRPIYIAHSWLLDDAGTARGYRDEEVLVQFSFRKRIAGPLYFAYSQKMFWQLYDKAGSRPIRENDYNPEFFLDVPQRWGLDLWRFGLWEHESNGGAAGYDAAGNPVNRSRSWNRVYVYGEQAVVPEVLRLAAKLWAVTDRRDRDTTSFGADNPDIQDYLGWGEVYAELGGRAAGATVLLRRGRLSGTATWRLEAWLGAERLFGVESSAAAYLQAFSGYGDSLIDYDRKVRRIALGVRFR